jgi:hypothetical protein
VCHKRALEFADHLTVDSIVRADLGDDWREHATHGMNFKQVALAMRAFNISPG